MPVLPFHCYGSNKKELSMIQRRRTNIVPQLVFLFLTFIAAVGGAYVGLRLISGETERTAIPQIITVEYIITATPPPATAEAAISFATQRAQVQLPADIANPENEAAATIDPFFLQATDIVISTPTITAAGSVIQSQNCLYHYIVSGDTPFELALRYEVDFQEILEVNNLTLQSATNLQVGDALIIPLEGCEILDDSGASTSVETADEAAPPAAQATSAPVNVQFELIEVEGLGDITSEGIHLRNNGERLIVTNWILSDSQANTYTFPEQLLFPGEEIVIYTRSGTSTGDVRFWGRDESVWEEGEEFAILDEDGRVLQILNIPGPVVLE